MYRSQDEEDDEKADEDKADSDAEDSKDSDDEKQHVRNSFLRPDQAFVMSLCLCPHTPVVMKCHLQDEL